MASTVKEKALEASKSEVIQLRRVLRRTERDAAASKVASTAAAAKARDTIGKFANAFNKMREAKGESDRTVAELRAAVARITLETEVGRRNQQREMEATFDDLRDDFDEQLAAIAPQQVARHLHPLYTKISMLARSPLQLDIAWLYVLKFCF